MDTTEPTGIHFDSKPGNIEDLGFSIVDTVSPDISDSLLSCSLEEELCIIRMEGVHCPQDLMSYMAANNLLPTNPAQFLHFLQVGKEWCCEPFSTAEGEIGENGYGFAVSPVRTVDALGQTVVCAYFTLINEVVRGVITNHDPGRDNKGNLEYGYVLAIRYVHL